MFLVDTNVLSEIPRPRPDSGVLRWLGEHPDFALSPITIEELALGIAKLKGEKKDRLVRWFEELLAIPPHVIHIDERIARIAGELRAARGRSGKTVAQADMLIAATALVSSRVLVTRNVKHFEHCGISLLDPFSQSSS